MNDINFVALSRYSTIPAVMQVSRNATKAPNHFLAYLSGAYFCYVFGLYRLEAGCPNPEKNLMWSVVGPNVNELDTVYYLDKILVASGGKIAIPKTCLPNPYLRFGVTGQWYKRALETHYTNVVYAAWGLAKEYFDNPYLGYSDWLSQEMEKLREYEDINDSKN